MTNQMPKPMEISDHDREAFHSQADRVADAIDDDFNEVDRADQDTAVRSVFMTMHEGEAVVVTMKVLPNHRFLVKTDDGRTRTTRRDDVVEAINGTLS